MAEQHDARLSWVKPWPYFDTHCRGNLTSRCRREVSQAGHPDPPPVGRAPFSPGTGSPTPTPPGSAPQPPPASPGHQ